MTANETSPLLRHDDEDETPKDKSTLQLAFVVMPMALGVFLAAMDTTIVISSYAAIGTELKQLQSTSWIATGYMLTLTSFQPLYGKMSDIFGRKACLIFSYCVFALGCLLCGMANGMVKLVVARALAGIGGGGMTTVATIILSDIVPMRSRGTWQGIMNIVFGAGCAAGAPIGGLITDTIGWRWSFIFQAPVTLAAIVFVSSLLHPPPSKTIAVTNTSNFRKKLARVDFAGSFFLIAFVFSLLLGLDRGGNLGWSDPITIASLSTAFILLILLVHIEFNVACEPLAPKRIIANRAFYCTYICNFFHMAGGMTSMYYVSLYLQAVLQKTPREAGLMLMPPVFGGIMGSLMAGLVIQATGKYRALTNGAYGVVLIGSMMTLLSSGVVGRSTAGIIVGMVLGTIGQWTSITTTLISLVANATSEDQAIATAVSYLFRSLGGVLGLSTSSALLQVALKSQLHKHLVGDNVDEVIRHVRESLSYVETLDPQSQRAVNEAYEWALQSVLLFSWCLTVCAFVSSFFMKEVALKSKGR